MPAYTTADIRNIALIGHTHSGKTSLIESLLRTAGAVHHLGLVEKGNTLSDYTDEERARGSSIYNTITHCDYRGKHINIIDTPGAADFAGQAMAGLNAVETAVLVINAMNGIEPNARRLFQRAGESDVDRMIVVNKIDGENVDLETLIVQIQETFGPECVPINVPADGGKRVIDCLRSREGMCDFGPVDAAHTAIVERIIEMDDVLMNKYFADGDVPLESLHAPFEKALEEGHLIPICFTVARSHLNVEQTVGIKELLEVLVDWAPNPAEGKRHSFIKVDGSGEIIVDPDPAKPVLAHIFKVVNDRFGKMGVFRVFQGAITKDSQVFVGDHKKPAKIAHIYSLQGKDHHEIDAAIAGDICAVLKVDEVALGEVFQSQPNGRLKLHGEAYPEPMVGLAVAPKKRGDEQKLADALHRVQSEEPAFKIERNAVTHEMVIYGMGEQHLRNILDKMKNKLGVEVDTHPPKIAYKETVGVKAEGHHRHKKQSGGAGQFGEVYLRVVPLERGAGFEFVDDTVGGKPPRQYLPAIEKGVRQAFDIGCIAGYPMQDIRVEVYDGKHHDVDSKEIAFTTAGRKAFIDAVSKGRPTVLEPIVNIEISVPAQFMGTINGDLSGKRGRIQGTDTLPGDMISIKAQVPLAEVTDYQGQLKSVTGGLGTYTMEFSHYDPVPHNVQAQIVAQYKPRAEED